MKMKKLAIATAIAMMGVGAAQAQVSTPTENTTADNSTGLMTELSNSLTNVFNAGRTSTIVAAMAGSPAEYATADALAIAAGNDTYTFVNGAYVKDLVPTVGNSYITKAAVAGVAQTTTLNLANPVDITALAGAVNLSAINGSIDISGTNVSITGVAGDVGAKAESIASTTSTATSFAINGNNFSTTVIGAMNSSTLDIMAKTTALTNSASSGLDVASLASQGGAISLATPSVTPVVDGIGSTIASVKLLDGSSIAGTVGLDGLAGTADDIGTSSLQQDLAGLSANTMSDVTSNVDELQSMNVFNMALNAAPIVAGVKIAAAVDPNAWFLNPQTGIVNVSNLQIATTAIGAMNSSITHLGKNLTTLAK